MSHLTNFEIDGQELTFDVKNIDKSLLNALRRIMISEVPTIGFNTDYGKETDIIIEENTSSLHNEFLSHRLSLIPVHYEPKLIDKYEKSKYKFTIDVTNNTSKMMDVTTEHIEITDTVNNKILSKQQCKQFFPPDSITNDYILINKLKPNKSGSKDNGESLKIEMYASKSIGKIHSRYTPTCVSVFTNKRDDKKIKLKLNQIINKKNEELKQKNKSLLTEDDIKKITKSFMVCDADMCFHTDEYGEPNYFKYTVESDGRIPSHIIFHKSLDVLKEKIDYFTNSLDNEDIIVFSKSDCIMPSYDINITDEDHTLGYLLQHYMYLNFYNIEKKKISYISSTIPHPLVNKLLIRISLVEKNMKEDYIKSLFKDCIKEIKKDLDSINKELVTNKLFNF